MKVFALKSDCDDGYEIVGLFSTKQKAVEAIPYQPGNSNKEDILEFEIDPQYDGEPYENIRYCNIFESGEVGHYNARCRLSEMEAPSYGGHYMPSSTYAGVRNFCAVAYGRTDQEAEYKARAAFALINPIWEVCRLENGEMHEVLYPHISEIRESPRLPCAHHKDLNTARIILWAYEKTGELNPNLRLPPI